METIKVEFASEDKSKLSREELGNHYSLAFPELDDVDIESYLQLLESSQPPERESKPEINFITARKIVENKNIVPVVTGYPKGDKTNENLLKFSPGQLVVSNAIYSVNSDVSVAGYTVMPHVSIIEKPIMNILTSTERIISGFYSDREAYIRVVKPLIPEGGFTDSISGGKIPNKKTIKTSKKLQKKAKIQKSMEHVFNISPDSAYEYAVFDRTRTILFMPYYIKALLGVNPEKLSDGEKLLSDVLHFKQRLDLIEYTSKFKPDVLIQDLVNVIENLFMVEVSKKYFSDLIWISIDCRLNVALEHYMMGNVQKAKENIDLTKQLLSRKYKMPRIESENLEKIKIMSYNEAIYRWLYRNKFGEDAYNTAIKENIKKLGFGRGQESGSIIVYGSILNFITAKEKAMIKKEADRFIETNTSETYNKPWNIIYRKLRSAVSLYDKNTLLNELLEYITKKELAVKDNWITIEGKPVICPHYLELVQMQIAKAQPRDIRDMLSKYIDAEGTFDSYYCKICQEKLYATESMENNINVGDEYGSNLYKIDDELKDWIWKQVSYIVRGNVEFLEFSSDKVINKFISSMVNVLYDYIYAINKKIMVSKSITEAESEAKLKIFTIIYGWSLLIKVVGENSDKIRIHGFTSKTKNKSGLLEYVIQKIVKQTEVLFNRLTENIGDNKAFVNNAMRKAYESLSSSIGKSHFNNKVPETDKNIWNAFNGVLLSHAISELKPIHIRAYADAVNKLVKNFKYKAPHVKLNMDPKTHDSIFNIIVYYVEHQDDPGKEFKDAVAARIKYEDDMETLKRAYLMSARSCIKSRRVGGLRLLYPYDPEFIAQTYSPKDYHKHKFSLYKYKLGTNTKILDDKEATEFHKTNPDAYFIDNVCSECKVERLKSKGIVEFNKTYKTVAFYNYYEFRCPKADNHTFDAKSRCKICGYEKDFAKTHDAGYMKKYYDVYTKAISKHSISYSPYKGKYDYPKLGQWHTKHDKEIKQVHGGLIADFAEKTHELIRSGSSLPTGFKQKNWTKNQYKFFLSNLGAAEGIEIDKMLSATLPPEKVDTMALSSIASELINEYNTIINSANIAKLTKNLKEVIDSIKNKNLPEWGDFYEMQKECIQNELPINNFILWYIFTSLLTISKEKELLLHMISIIYKSQTEFNALKQAVSAQLQANDTTLDIVDSTDEKEDIMEEALDPDYLSTFGYDDMDYDGDNDDFD